MHVQTFQLSFCSACCKFLLSHACANTSLSMMKLILVLLLLSLPFMPPLSLPVYPALSVVAYTSNYLSMCVYMCAHVTANDVRHICIAACALIDCHGTANTGTHTCLSSSVLFGNNHID
uniref:Uncharacterized protein n=1 Tax=Schistocephalus solidus TaxID=70667 RepID=A0A0X3Q0T4_SCHSO